MLLIDPPKPETPVGVELEFEPVFDPVFEPVATDPPPPPQDKSIAQAKIIRCFIIYSQKTNKSYKKKAFRRRLFSEFPYFNLQ